MGWDVRRGEGRKGKERRGELEEMGGETSRGRGRGRAGTIRSRHTHADGWQSMYVYIHERETHRGVHVMGHRWLDTEA